MSGAVPLSVKRTVVAGGRTGGDGQLRRPVARTPQGRLGQPPDIADVVALRAGDEARWVTGQVILATGGLA